LPRVRRVSLDDERVPHVRVGEPDA
jgi:hypothetical protein